MAPASQAAADSPFYGQLVVQNVVGIAYSDLTGHLVHMKYEIHWSSATGDDMAVDAVIVPRTDGSDYHCYVSGCTVTGDGMGFSPKPAHAKELNRANQARGVSGSYGGWPAPTSRTRRSREARAALTTWGG
jgi:hypothetical protein